MSLSSMRARCWALVGVTIPLALALGCGDNFPRARFDDGAIGLPNGAIGFPDAAQSDAGLDPGEAGLPDAGAPDGTPDTPDTPDTPVLPDWVHRGPGNPGRTFTDDQLFRNCAYLDGGKGDIYDHHDLAVMFDGYMLLAWAPEWGKGGLTFYDISDPCAPVTVSSTESAELRETHTIGFSNQDGVWAVTGALADNMTGGVAIWDVSDTRAPRFAARLDVPGFHYPDGYAGVVFWAFWQGRYIYLGAGDNGLVIVDVAVPSAPKIVKQLFFQPFLRVHLVQAIGNLLFVTQSGSPRMVVMDISDPLDPQPIPGGDFDVRDRDGNVTNKYASNVSGGYAFFAAQPTNAGGVIVYDLRDPMRPTFVGDYRSPGGAGAYVSVQEPYLFAGDSTFGTVLDMTDPANLIPVGTLDLVGDLDFVTPIGNLAILSVDDAAEPDRASAVTPWRREPDRRPPRVTFSVPQDGATGLPIGSRIGLTFSEAIDAMSAWRSGAVRLRQKDGGEKDGVLVDAIINAQDTILSVSPRQPLKPLTWYTLEIPAGVIEDWSGNAVAVPFTMTFETAAP